MYIILDYFHHSFTVCDELVEVRDKVETILSSGVSSGFVEIVNACEEDNRVSAEEFLIGKHSFTCW